MKDLSYFILGFKNPHVPELLAFKKVNILIIHLHVPFLLFTDNVSITALDMIRSVMVRGTTEQTYLVKLYLCLGTFQRISLIETNKLSNSVVE